VSAWGRAWRQDLPHQPHCIEQPPSSPSSSASNAVWSVAWQQAAMHDDLTHYCCVVLALFSACMGINLLTACSSNKLTDRFKCVNNISCLALGCWLPTHALFYVRCPSGGVAVKTPHLHHEHDNLTRLALSGCSTCRTSSGWRRGCLLLAPPSPLPAPAPDHHQPGPGGLGHPASAGLQC